MKKTFCLFLTLCLFLSACISTALAVEVLPMNGSYTPEETPTEPIVTPDPRAVQVGSDREDLIENGEFEDQGTVWVEWSGTAISLYGCTTAKINYTNPSRSNIGVTMAMAIFDEDLIEYFGTTFRSKEEQIALAKTGLEALNEGISLGSASKMVTITNYFEGLTSEEVEALSPEELVNLLGEKNFIGMNAEELQNLKEEDLANLSEEELLELAKLGDYNPKEWYYVIGQNALINPGWAIYEIDLYTLPGLLVLPKGEYKAVYVLNAYMEDKNEMSDFFIHLPITLKVQDDLPEDLQKEYGVTMAVRIDQ